MPRQTTSTQTGQPDGDRPDARRGRAAPSAGRSLRRFGMFWSAATAALLADVARSPLVPGANDNLSSVAVLLALARGSPSIRPGRAGVAALNGERGVVHGGDARLHVTPRRRTGPGDDVASSRSSASARLTSRSSRARACCACATTTLPARRARRLPATPRRPVWRGLRLGRRRQRRATGAPGGLPSACLAAVTDLKTPSNYHWPSDVPGEPQLGDDRRSRASR